MVKNIFFTTIVVMFLILMSAISFMFIQSNALALDKSIGSEVSADNTAVDVDVVKSEVAVESMVTISGIVVYDNFKKGCIQVFWVKEDGDLESGRPEIGESVILKEPGIFSIKVPKDVGSINIVINYYDQFVDVSNINVKTPKVAFISYGPVEIGSDNVELGDLRLEETKKPLMEDYNGLTVRITGKVLVDKYEKGLILILVEDEKSFKEKNPSKIAFKRLVSPGDYTIELPQGVGNVCVYALNVPTNDPEEARGNMPGTRVGYYDGNPINIKSSDLGNIDILIK